MKQVYTIKEDERGRFVLEHHSLDGMSEGRSVYNTRREAERVLAAWKRIDKAG